MKTSQEGIDLIKGFEGHSAKAYRCPSGVLTIGYGTTEGVTSGQLVSKYQAEQLLIEHLSKDEDRLSALCLPITQNQFDALMSFIYNLGITAFIMSGLRKAIERNADVTIIEAEFMKWVNGGGRVLPGLVKRRRAEYELFTRITA
jgi:lysozyme